MVDTKQTGDVKNSTGNGEAKELIHMTHGHEWRRGMLEGRGYRGEEKWDDYNSIINKIY